MTHPQPAPPPSADQQPVGFPGGASPAPAPAEPVPAGPLVLTWTAAADDFAEGVLRTSNAVLRTFLVNLVIFGVIGGVLLLFGDRAFGFVMLLLVLWTLVFASPAGRRRALRRYWDQCPRRHVPMRATLGVTEGLLVEMPLQNARYSWTAFAEYVETRELFILRVGGERGMECHVALPKRGIPAPLTPDAVRAVLVCAGLSAGRGSVRS